MEFHDAGMIREFVKAVCARYKAGCKNLEVIFSLAEQHAFVKTLESDRASDVPDRMDEEERN